VFVISVLCYNNDDGNNGNNNSNNNKDGHRYLENGLTPLHEVMFNNYSHRISNKPNSTTKVKQNNNHRSMPSTSLVNTSWRVLESVHYLKRAYHMKNQDLTVKDSLHID